MVSKNELLNNLLASNLASTSKSESVKIEQPMFCQTKCNHSNKPSQSKRWTRKNVDPFEIQLHIDLLS
jgi:hypothetical protein